MKLDWQAETPFAAIIFDVDGTLAAMEGADQIAEENGVGAEVQALTENAMSNTGINPALYQQRLALIQPRQAQVLALGQQYYRARVADIDAVIQLLQRLHKVIYLVSAGLLPAVRLFGEMLKVPSKNIIAVDLSFDAQGNYLDFDHDSPLITVDGKKGIAEHLMQQYHTVLHIGDGLNDMSARHVVTRFVGYGGVYYRANLEALCDFYIKSRSMSALLPLVLTQYEVTQLTVEEQQLYLTGMQAIEQGNVKIAPQAT